MHHHASGMSSINVPNTCQKFVFYLKKQYSLFVVSLHEFTICGRYFDIKTRKKQVRATMGLGGWGSDHLMTWWSYMFHHESSIFREFSWIFRGSLWGWKLIWPKAATCGHSLGSIWSGHLGPFAATRLQFSGVATCGHLLGIGWSGHLRPLAATCGHSSGCKWLRMAAGGF